MTLALVTGGGGYVAGSLVPELLRAGYRVRRLCRDPARIVPVAGAGDAVEICVGDLTRAADVERAAADADIVFHLGGQTSVYVAEENPEADLAANVSPMLRLLEVCRASGRRPTLLFAGTATEVGLTTRLPVDEGFTDAPITVYDMHKLLAERHLLHRARGGSVRGASLRLANVYGPGPASSRPDRGVLNTMVKRALSGDRLLLYGRGEFVRDYVYVGDVARAFVLAAQKADAVNGRHFLVGSGRGTTVAEAVALVARLVFEHTGRAVAVEQVPPPSGLSPIETRHFVADPRALFEATGFRADTSLEEGLLKTIAHFHAAGSDS